MICLRVILFASTSSEIKHTFGCVCNAHSRAMWLAERPISLMKCQYFFAELASLSIFPISSEYVLQAVSKPKLVSICSFLRSPSIVFGTPITLVDIPAFTNVSASKAAFVFESSPPMITIASNFNFFAVSIAAAYCSGVSIFVLPEPIMSNPPVLRNSSMYLSLISIYLLSVRPDGPFKNP